MSPEDAGAYFGAHRSEIEEKALQGDRGCLTILSLRRMFYASPNDPGALGLLVAAIQEYAKQSVSVPPQSQDQP